MIQRLPLAVVCAAIVILGAYDFYAQLKGLQTISAFTWEVCQRYPFVPFATGLICGHLFWGSPPKKEIEL